MIYWGATVKKDEVIAFLKSKSLDENDLHVSLTLFEGLTADEYAYRYGWGKVLKVLERAFQNGC